MKWGVGYPPFNGYPGPYGYPNPQMQEYTYGYPGQNDLPTYALPPAMYLPNVPSTNVYTYPPPPWASPGADLVQASTSPKQDVPPPTHDWSLDHPLQNDDKQQG